jgi:LuxR family quorum-sensing system transcriptional regulator CciR
LRDGPAASISFANKKGRSLEAGAIPLAYYLGGCVNEARQGIIEAHAQPSADLGELTRRQLQCVILIARGKTDWEASKVLGISKDTVHKHILQAMRRLGVRTRTQLVVQALGYSHVSFRDVLD